MVGQRPRTAASRRALGEDRFRQLREMRVVMRDGQHGAAEENRECDDRCLEHALLPSITKGMSATPDRQFSERDLTCDRPHARGTGAAKAKPLNSHFSKAHQGCEKAGLL